MGRWLNRAKIISREMAKTPCAECAETPFCTNCTLPPPRFFNSPADLTLYRNRLAQSAGVPFDWLELHFFTADDLSDIKSGLYSDPVTLGELIRTDMRYPFGWPDRGSHE